jgi:hypothetical protein
MGGSGAARASSLIHSFMLHNRNCVVPRRAWMLPEQLIRSHRMRAAHEVDRSALVIGISMEGCVWGT